jgi:predicted TIM-barrel fold metal-dependent hydrolase
VLCIIFLPHYIFSTVGPALEAFGYERILFGSSPSPSSRAKSNAGDWYELARESFAELGTEQEDIDAVFFGNASRVYGS